MNETVPKNDKYIAANYTSDGNGFSSYAVFQRYLIDHIINVLCVPRTILHGEQQVEEANDE